MVLLLYSTYSFTKVVYCIICSSIIFPTIHLLIAIISYNYKYTCCYRYLLLGHSRKDIYQKLMPQFHREGQKRVDRETVNRVQKVLTEDKHHKLREGHDLASLLGRDEGRGRMVYPWPTQTNCPVRNAKHVEYCKQKAAMLATINKRKGDPSPGITLGKSLEEQEVVEAINSIAAADGIAGGENANLDPLDGSRGEVGTELAGDSDVILAEPTNESQTEVANATNKSDIITQAVNPVLSDEAIDPQAFETLRQKALRLTERLTPTLSGTALI